MQLSVVVVQLHTAGQVEFVDLETTSRKAMITGNQLFRIIKYCNLPFEYRLN
jgi:hypothetical protein